MRRALLVVSLAGAIAACGGVKLEDYRRPFACDHHGGDGGPQCAAGWACGFDDRCFDQALDGGQAVVDWRCEKDAHCPPDWRCGEQVDSQRYCQQLGVGAPSRCATDDGGCQGGWRCSAASRCFDPSLTEGGPERECTRNGQCPDHYRCGEGVTDASVSHCIQLGVGAASTCHSDQGCEGTYRCDPLATHCVEVTDVVTSGRLESPGFTLVSPLSTRGVPLKFALTRVSRVPSAFGGSAAGLDPLHNFPFGPALQSGVLMASLYPDGVLVAAQLTNGEMRQSDGGRGQQLFQQLYPLRRNPADVTELVATIDGPVVRYLDGTVEWVLLDGGTATTAADLIRQSDSLDPNGTTQVLVVDGGTVTVRGAPVAFPDPVNEAVGFESNFQVSLFVITDAGSFFSRDAGPLFLPDGGAALARVGPALPNTPSLGVVAGFASDRPSRRLSLFVQVPRGDGGVDLVSYTPTNQSDWNLSEPYPACPDGRAPLQLAFVEDADLRPSVVARCSGADGGTFPVLVRNKGAGAEYSGVVEDQTPFRGEVVVQRASPFIRAHAAASGRVWHTLDPDGYGVVGQAPLRPLVLDRQPDTIVTAFDPTLNRDALVAQAQHFLFKADPGAGLVSMLADQPVAPLAVIPGHPNWILTNLGVIDLSTSTDGPRLMALMPAPQVLSAPVTGFAVQLPRGSSLRQVIIASSGDTLWAADVTEAMTSAFAQPAIFEAVLVPVPGVRLHSMTLETTDGGLSGYLTTNTQNLRFGTPDLVRWSLSSVAAPAQAALPVEVWAEGGKGRTGFSDGRVWSLPIMVPLTQPLLAADGGALAASDFARKCGDLFAASAEGLFRAEPSDGGLPRWVAIDAGTALGPSTSLRLYETQDRLFVATDTGRVLEVVSPTSCP